MVNHHAGRRGVAGLLVFAVVAVLAFVGPAVALRKPCGKFCRGPIQDCKDQCTGGKHKRVRCRLGCKIIYTVVCREFSGPSCLPPTLACGPTPLTCTLISLNFPDWRATGGRGLPADFPGAPDGSTLCGGVRRSNESEEIVLAAFLNGDDPAAVIAQYSTGFASNGYTMTEEASAVAPGRPDCDRAFRITRNGAAVGGLYYFASQGAFFLYSGSAAPPLVKR